MPWAGHLAALALGALTVAGFAPYSLWPLPLLTLAGLYALLRRATPRQAWQFGYLFGLGLFGVGVSWVYVSLHRYGGMPAALATAATLGFCAFLALFPASACWLTVRLQTGSPPHQSVRPMLFAASWLLCEWTRGWIFTGFPWLALGYAQIPGTALAGWAPVLGVYGVGALGVYCSALLASALQPHRATLIRLRHATLATLPLLLGLLADAVTAPLSQPQGAPLTVSLLQGSIAQELKWQPQRIQLSLATYQELTLASQGRLIVMPETAIPLLTEQVADDYWRSLQGHARQRQGDILVGLPQREGGHYYNAMMSLGQSPRQSYRKHHLVPFGEFIPDGFGWILRWLHIPMSDFGRGPPHQAPLQVAGQQVAVNICYEDAFGEEIIQALPAATLLVNVSNDAWFGDSLAPHQHLQMAQARARETGRPLLRATNSGISAVIDHRGQVQATLGLQQQGVLEATTQGRQGRMPYVLWGNTLAVSTALVVLLSAWRRARTTSGWPSRA